MVTRTFRRPLELVVVLCIGICLMGWARCSAVGTRAVAEPTPIDTALDAVRKARADLAAAGVINYGTWQAGDLDHTTELTFVVKKVPAADTNRGMEELKIFEPDGRPLYTVRADRFGVIGPRELFPNSGKRSQLVIGSVNYGGNGDFLQILDVQDGKVVSLTAEEDGFLYTGFAVALPRYDAGGKYFARPFQFVLQEHLTDDHAVGRVLRFVDGKFRDVGEIEMKTVGKMIEDSIEKRSAPSNSADTKNKRPRIERD